MSAFFRSRLLWAAVAFVALAVLAARFWLGGYAVRYVLGLAGATKITYAEVRATPWRCEVTELRFVVRTQVFAARRVTVEREHWWQASLGQVRVEGAEAAVTLDGSDTDPWDWSTYEEAGLGGEPVNLPFRSLDLDGSLVVRVAGADDRPVTVHLEARPKGGASWIGSLVAEAEGFRLAGGGTLLRAGQELDFQVHSAELDLAAWSAQIQRLVPLPGSPWSLGGKLSGVAEGKVTAQRFAATARVTLHEGRMRAASRDISATGAEAELEFSDLWKLRTKAGSLRLQELRIGRLPLTGVAVDFGLWDGKNVIVHGARFATLGGSGVLQPCRFQLRQRELALTVDAAGLDLAGVLGMLDRLPVQLAGRVNGSLAMRIHDSGVRLERSRLELAPGQPGELRIGAATLLRSGAVLADASQRQLKEAGTELQTLRLGALSLDIRSGDLPLGTSARLVVTGDTERGPLAFTFDVNGSVEKHLRILPP